MHSGTAKPCSYSRISSRISGHVRSEFCHSRDGLKLTATVYESICAFRRHILTAFQAVETFRWFRVIRHTGSLSPAPEQKRRQRVNWEEASLQHTLCTGTLLDVARAVSSALTGMARHDFIRLPDAQTYILGNARVPACCVEQQQVAADTSNSSAVSGKGWQTCVDGLLAVDVEVSGDKITAIRPAAGALSEASPYLDVRESMVFPAFVDLHTHIGENAPLPRPALVGLCGISIA